MVAKDRKNKTDSPKVEVGEIDTQAPFQSVKDAVNLFGEGAFSGEKLAIKKIKPHSAERVLAKETQFHMAQKELNKLKEQLKSAEITKSEALMELEEAKRTLEDLKTKLQMAEMAKDQAKQIDHGQTDATSKVKSAWEQNFEATKKKYAAIVTELDVKKQSHKVTLARCWMKLLALRNEVNPEISEVLEAQMAEMASEIDNLQKEMENVKSPVFDSLKNVTFEFDVAKESLQRVAEEESSLKSLLESLKMELENVRKEHEEVKEKEAETESNLKVKAMISEKVKVKGASNEMTSALQQLSSESENAKREAEEMKKESEALKKEAEAMKFALEEAEGKLSAALDEAEEAKAAEAKVLEEIKLVSERTEAARASTLGSRITMSGEEFELLSRKIEESEKLAEMKVGAAMAHVEAVKASENEAVKRLEAAKMEVEEMRAAREVAVKRAEMAMATKKTVEGELRKWREWEREKAAKTASRILRETYMSSLSAPSRSQNQNSPSKVNINKNEKSKESVTKKVLGSNLSAIFQRKKNPIDGRSSPSYLPGEKPN